MTTASVSPLRQRMIDDMRLRQYGEKTQHDYVREVAAFARFLGRSPDQAEPEDLRRYQLQLAAQGDSPGKMNLAVSALRFFFQVTLCRPAFGAAGAGAQGAAAAGRAQSRGGGAAAALRAQPEAQGGAQLRLWLRPAGLGDRPPEGRRHRQCADADPRRAGQGPQGPLCELSPDLLELLRTWWRGGPASEKLNISGSRIRSRNLTFQGSSQFENSPVNCNRCP